MTKQEYESRPYVIAIDFDGTLCENEWPGIGVPRWGVIRAAQEAKRNGAILVLWTCRSGTALNEAFDAAAKWGLVFDYVNENPKEMVELWGNDPRKVGADEYWDDKSRLMTTMNDEIDKRLHGSFSFCESDKLFNFAVKCSTVRTKLKIKKYDAILKKGIIKQTLKGLMHYHLEFRSAHEAQLYFCYRRDYLRNLGYRVRIVDTLPNIVVVGW